MPSQRSSNLRIAVICPPFPSTAGRWVTVPPRGYGGIQWAIAHLIDGLSATGAQVFLLGAPGSPLPRTAIAVPVADEDAILEWLSTTSVDVVHDHANFHSFALHITQPYLSTWHLTGAPSTARSPVYLSFAQRSAGSASAPIVRLPVNPARFMFSEAKDDYLLYLGRVSEWKGVLEAAQFARASALPLVVAGPTWEPEYARAVSEAYPGGIRWAGEVHGEDRRKLLARARAVMVMSRSVAGPWGAQWSEPGAMVVSEAAASGTPVIGSANGCLAEIVPLVGMVLDEDTIRSPAAAGSLLQQLPAPRAVRARAIRAWGHRRIACQYIDLYDRVLAGEAWR